MDLLAKHATRLPLEGVAPEQPHSIVLAGAEAPTPAQKWINTFRRYGTWTGCHWTTWLPMRGTWRMLSLQWLWGNIRWEGCAAPWDKSRADCSVCNDMHGQTAHKRLIQCPTWRAPFLQAWATSARRADPVQPERAKACRKKTLAHGGSNNDPPGSLGEKGCGKCNQGGSNPDVPRG